MMNATKTTTAPSPPTAGQLDILRSLPGGKALAFAWWPARGPEVVIGAAIEVLALNPGASKADLMRLEHEVWSLARLRPVGPDGEAVDVMLSRIGGVTPLGDIRVLLQVLIGAGDLVATLTRQRRVIDSLLEQIATVRAGRASTS